MSAPGRQSGSRSATLPSGRTSAASPGKSSSAAEPACPASAIHSPSRCACRVASRRPDPSHHVNPLRQEASSVHRPYNPRSEEHTSELQSRPHLVCRLLLEKKKKNKFWKSIEKKKKKNKQSRVD